MSHNIESMPIFVFYHLFQVNNWQAMYCEQLLNLKNSGLFDVCKNIFIYVNGNKPLPFYHPKIKVFYNKIFKSEAQTLKQIYFFCKRHDVIICYFHSKGVTSKNTNTQHWRRYLESYIFFKWKDIVNFLKYYDCVGVEWKTNDLMLEEFNMFKPFYGYFSGNFWWSKSSYIKNLNLNDLFILKKGLKIKNVKRLIFTLPELWIGTKNPCVYNFQTLSGYLPQESFYSKNAIVEHFNETRFNYS